MIELKKGDRVTRKSVNNFKSMAGEPGTIVTVFHSNHSTDKNSRAYIRWDRINKTGQQHSTVQFRFLTLINNNEDI